MIRYENDLSIRADFHLEIHLVNNTCTNLSRILQCLRLESAEYVQEIQKIVVFEGAFDRLFNIIREEGGSEGGIIVQDCLELLNNLLRNNPSNQVNSVTMFSFC